jgi:Flp pilus assembly pilin Flp
MTEYTLAVGFVALATAAAASVFASGVTKSITLSIAKALGKI